MTPKISICIPTFNRSDLLDKALKSVSLQTVKPFELIVVDNASTDNTKEVVNKYKNIGVKYFRNKKNVGMVNNWNVCIEKSSGDYITLLHNDDLIAPNWYQEMAQAVRSHPKVKFFTCSLLIIDNHENVQNIYHTFSSSRLIKKDNAIEQFWTHLLPGFAPTAANLWHKDVFKKIGIYEEKFGTEADVVSSFKILKEFDICYINSTLFAYRSHDKQGFDKVEQIKSLAEEIKRKKNHYTILKKFYEEFYHSSSKQRFFIQYPILMTLSPVTLFLVKLKFKKVFLHFKLAREIFPDLFYHPTDLIIYVKILLIFIKRTSFSNIEVYKRQNEYNWLKQI